MKPRLRAHVRIHRQHFRGQLWYVLQDHASGRYHRFSPSAYYIIGSMDGRRTVQEIWDLACSQFGDDIVTQEELIRLLSQLHQSDILYSDVAPNVEHMSDRARKRRRRTLIASFINPLAVRLPLLDPEEFLRATMPAMRPFFTWLGALLIAGLIAYGVVLAAMHWGELTGNLVDRVLATEGLVALFVTYPLVKGLHELGHGYAVKRWGGEVHELGVMFLVLMPVPYVDASAASAFRDKWRRAVVGAAGIIVELVLASLALMLWLNSEPGWLRSFAFSVILIGGVSTLVFNGNPLLRFDGYYVLSDVLEIPNLGVRANRYIGYLIQRQLFGVRAAQSPATAPSERKWLFLYAIASFCYRLMIAFAIILFVATHYFIVGVLLAVWAGIAMLALPLAKHVRFLFTSPVLRRNRGRAFAVTAGILCSLAIVLCAVPVPHSTVAQGVVWMSKEAAVHAPTEGVVTNLLRAPNTRVRRGDPLLALEDPFLETEVRILEARVRELTQRLDSAKVSNAAEARIVEEQLNRIEAELAQKRQRKADLIVRSPADGDLILMRPAELVGRFVKQGELIAYVAALDSPVIQVIVAEDSADIVRKRTKSVEVRVVDRLDEVRPAVIARELPSVTDRLPSLALGTVGGGEVNIDPRKPEEAKALSKLLHLELEFRPQVVVRTLGARVYVRFYHGEEPIAWRIYRSLRQLFLRHLNV